MRKWSILLVFVLANTIQAEEIARPVPPEFIQTQLVSAWGATPQQAVAAAYGIALAQARPGTTTQQIRATNHAVAEMVPHATGWSTQVWVTVRTAN